MNEDIKNPFQLLVKYWVIIVLVGGIIAMWTTITNKVDVHGEEIKALKAQDALTAASHNQILVELVAIRADLVWLKNNLK